jgi:ribosomal protein S18 acetylase RimI-like enzyme
MVGFIRDNGLVSLLNRGTFYGCRNRKGELEGVALIGHATLMETTTDRALEAFAEIARTHSDMHLIMAERERMEEFWNYYADYDHQMRLACRELLMELQWPVAVQESVDNLRLATVHDLELIMPVQAQMAFDESGVNPLETDPKGFRERCLRRIEQGRSWVLVADGQLLFKTEVMSETAEVTYLEGIWVNPSARGSRTGSRCVSQLARTLLANTNSLCVLVNQNNLAAQRMYQHTGFKLRSTYDTIFV